MNDNKILLKKISGEIIAIPQDYYDNFEIKISGKGNEIILEEPNKYIRCSIRINGDNNKVIIEKSPYMIRECKIIMDQMQPLSNRCVHIKKNFQCTQMQIYCWPNNSKITIGEDCLFAWNITLLSGDGHKLIDNKTGEILNKNSCIEIGDNVWVGHSACINKNVFLPNNTIVGTAAVVTRKFKKQYTAIAGNPATIVKEGVSWDRDEDF